MKLMSEYNKKMALRYVRC